MRQWYLLRSFTVTFWECLTFLWDELYPSSTLQPLCLIITFSFCFSVSIGSECICTCKWRYTHVNTWNVVSVTILQLIFLRHSLLLDKDLVAFATLASQGDFCICLTLSSNPQMLCYRCAMLCLIFIWLLRPSCLLIKHVVYWTFSTDTVWILLQSQGQKSPGEYFIYHGILFKL